MSTGQARASAGRRLPRRRWIAPLVAPALFLLFLIAIAVVPATGAFTPYAQNLSASLVEPFSRADGRLFLLGADPLGRDLLSRLVLAAWVSIAIGLAAVGVSLTMGVVLGLAAGYFRGLVENVIMGLADLQLAIPRVLLIIAAAAAVGPSVVNLAVILGLTSWVSYGRVARAMALSLREREFVLAAITQGASAAWNIRRHLLPNVLPQMAVIASFEFGQIIVLEASISYLGLGVQPPLPSLGKMVSEGQTFLEINPWLSILPGLFIFIVVAGVQVVSQRLTSEARDGMRLARQAGGRAP